MLSIYHQPVNPDQEPNSGCTTDSNSNQEGGTGIGKWTTYGGTRNKNWNDGKPFQPYKIACEYRMTEKVAEIDPNTESFLHDLFFN